MLKFTTVLNKAIPLGKNILIVTLPYDQRVVSRQKVTLDDGTEAGFFLPRGTVLKDGDHLQAESGELVKVQLAKEKVSTLYCRDSLLLARACYHLGNRHVSLQIERDMLRYQHDPVLDEMLKGLGLQVVLEEADFVPESGAYGGGHQHGEADVSDSVMQQDDASGDVADGETKLNKARRL